MKQKPITTVFYSAIGVVALFLVLVVVNFLNSFVKQRIDLTEEKSFTLSPGTRAILQKLDTPVQVRLYVTQRDAEMPVMLKSYAGRVEDLLAEFRQASKGLVEVQKLDPVPDSDAEDSARLDGVEGQMLPTGEKLYLGLSVSMLDKKQAIPFLSPERERQLEYDIIRAIASVSNPEKPVVGIMSSLPVSGMPSPMMMQMGGGAQPWAIYNELKQNYTLQTVDITAETIPDNVKVLMVIHPKTISERTEYAIDQFVMRGGKLIAFLDPLSVIDSQQSNRFGGGGMPSTSTFEKLLPAWGLKLSPEVVADMTYGARGPQGQRAPAVLALDETAFSKEDIITADASNALFAFGGAFTGTPAEGLKETVLMHSSKKSELVEPMLAQMSGDEVAKRFKSSGSEQALAIRLTGKFKTAFPNGQPKISAADPAKPDEKKDEKKEESLKESKQETSVILFADSDFIQDPIAVQELPNPFGGRERMVMPANGNLSLAENAVENLSGDSNLITLRSRSVVERPFTVVKRMQEDAESAYRSKIQDLESSLQEAQAKIGELQRNKEAGQKFILSPEQQKELENFRKKEAETKKELKDVRRSLRTDIDSLETGLKWLNIAAIPAVVAVAGLLIGLFQKRRSAAR